MVSSGVLRYGLALVLFAHGVGHVAGFWGESRQSWVLTDIVGESVTWAIEVVWMLLTTALFVGTAFALLGVVLPHQSWRPLAGFAAIVSIVGLIVFWGTWPEGTMLYALGFDIVVLLVVVWYGWPANGAIGL